VGQGWHWANRTLHIFSASDTPMGKLNSGSACYNTIYNIYVPVSYLKTEELKYTTLLLYLVFQTGSKLTWTYVIPREPKRLRVFQNKLPSKMPGPERKEETVVRNLYQKIFVIQCLSWNSKGWRNQGKCDGWNM